VESFISSAGGDFDDTSIYLTNPNLVTKYKLANEDLLNVYKWLATNKLSLNTSKTKYI